MPPFSETLVVVLEDLRVTGFVISVINPITVILVFDSSRVAIAERVAIPSAQEHE